jgi:hypothetical protein
MKQKAVTETRNCRKGSRKVELFGAVSRQHQTLDLPSSLSLCAAELDRVDAFDGGTALLVAGHVCGCPAVCGTCRGMDHTPWVKDRSERQDLQCWPAAPAADDGKGLTTKAEDLFSTHSLTH